MKITSAEFLFSAISPSQYPKDVRPEIAFVGRSNVGKSSLMNALLSKKGLAKTSGTPGKTQMLNFFNINRTFYFVDLPGYGYAKVPLQVKRKWGEVMTAYLRNRPSLKLVVHLVDARRKPSAQDEEMLMLLDEAEVPALIVATKIDKLKSGQRKKNIALIRETIDLDADAYVLPFSSHTGEGCRELWRVIEEQL